jgi:ABC-type proline/glycine betaine transport system substrate-binding protein
MTDEELSSINAAIDEADESEWQEVAANWVEENRDTVDAWLGR